MDKVTAWEAQLPEGTEKGDARMRHCLAAFTGKLLAIGTAETAMQLAILLYVADEDAERRTVRDMARTFDTSRPRITRNTDTLENLGYVARQADPRDRRSVIIKITPAGTRFLRLLSAAARDAFLNNTSAKPEAPQASKKAKRLAA
jgi:DNA-binding MarR family transcriptional regulator